MAMPKSPSLIILFRVFLVETGRKGRKKVEKGFGENSESLPQKTSKWAIKRQMESKRERESARAGGWVIEVREWVAGTRAESGRASDRVES